jgi:hypothetical protein
MIEINNRKHAPKVLKDLEKTINGKIQNSAQIITIKKNSKMFEMTDLRMPIFDSSKWFR